jgi:hypothetical protein
MTAAEPFLAGSGRRLATFIVVRIAATAFVRQVPFAPASADHDIETPECNCH